MKLHTVRVTQGTGELWPFAAAIDCPHDLASDQRDCVIYAEEGCSDMGGCAHDAEGETCPTLQECLAQHWNAAVGTEAFTVDLPVGETAMDFPLRAQVLWDGEGVVLKVHTDDRFMLHVPDGAVQCATHDGIPSTEEEDAEFEAGYDPCQPIVRLDHDRTVMLPRHLRKDPA